MPQCGRAAKDIPKGIPGKEKANMAEREINPDAHLLGLSGELRNVIYRLALLEEHDILVTQTSHTEPGLLQVCRQIRDEAKNIYRQENNFRLHVDNYEPILPAYPVHWIWKKSRFAWRFTGHASGMSRDNLKAWMRLIHAGRPVSLAECVSAGSRCVKIAARAARVVSKLRRARWSKVEVLLDEFIEGIAAVDPSFWA